jgi:hypothetical protein
VERKDVQTALVSILWLEYRPPLEVQEYSVIISASLFASEEIL